MNYKQNCLSSKVNDRMFFLKKINFDDCEFEESKLAKSFEKLSQSIKFIQNISESDLNMFDVNNNMLLNILFDLRDGLKIIPYKSYPAFDSSLYLFILWALNKFLSKPKVVEIILDVIVSLSMIDFPDEFANLYKEYQYFLKSHNTTIQKKFLEISRNYVCEERLFNLFYELNIYKDIILIIKTSGNIGVIRTALDYLYVFSAQCSNFKNENESITNLLKEIIIEVLNFLSSIHRNELISAALQVLEPLISTNNDIFQFSKEKNIENILIHHLNTTDSNLFFVLAKIIQTYFPESEIFNMPDFYNKFKTLLCNGPSLNENKNNINNMVESSYTLEEVIHLAISTITSLIESHYNLIKESGLYDIFMNTIEISTFLVKKDIFLFFTTYIVFSSIDERRFLINDDIINIIQNMIDTHDFSLLLNALTTFEVLLKADPQYWSNTINENFKENIDESSNYFFESNLNESAYIHVLMNTIDKYCNTMNIS